MARELVWGDGREFAYAKPVTIDWSAELYEDFPKGAELYRRGVQVTWDRERYVQIGVGPFNCSTLEPHDTAHYVTLDYLALRKLIRDLQKVGRQMYGPDPWS